MPMWRPQVNPDCHYSSTIYLSGAHHHVGGTTSPVSPRCSCLITNRKHTPPCSCLFCSRTHTPLCSAFFSFQRWVLRVKLGSSWFLASVYCPRCLFPKPHHDFNHCQEQLRAHWQVVHFELGSEIMITSWGNEPGMLD